MSIKATCKKEGGLYIMFFKCLYDEGAAVTILIAGEYKGQTFLRTVATYNSTFKSGYWRYFFFTSVLASASLAANK